MPSWFIRIFKIPEYYLTFLTLSQRRNCGGRRVKGERYMETLCNFSVKLKLLSRKSFKKLMEIFFFF